MPTCAPLVEQDGCDDRLAALLVPEEHGLLRLLELRLDGQRIRVVPDHRPVCDEGPAVQELVEVPEHIEICASATLPLADCLADRYGDTTHPSTEVDGVPVVESDCGAVDVEVRVVAGGHVERDALLGAEV